jgi:hypothetical protein
MTSELTLLNWNFRTILLREYFADWMQNTFYFDTTAKLFVTGETAVNGFIPVVSAYYLLVAV